jgi:anti-sigma factor ChrR (cupin superfamily)
MTELFEVKDSDSPSPLPLAIPAASASVATNQQDWQSAGVEGFWIKPLYENDQCKQRTWLMKVDAGAWSPAHAHDELEQILVLEGSFYDEEKSYGPGDFILRAPGAMHTAGSEQGAIVMLVYTSVNL